MDSKPVVIGTGLSGMIGSRFADLFEKQFTFINLDLSANIDITNQQQVDEILSKQLSTTVIHLAAFTDVSQAYQETGDKKGIVYRVNTLGSKNIAQSCQKNDHYLIHISTDFVFDGENPPTGGYTEADRPRPIEWYGQTKLWAEQEVQKSNCRHAIVRLAFPFRSNFPKKKDLVRSIFERLKNQSLHPLFTDQIITPTFIDDICQGLKIFIDRQPQGIYHLVGNTPLSPYQLAQKIAEIFQLPGEIKKGSLQAYLQTDPRPRQKNLNVSNQKIKEDLGIEMKDIDTALKEMKKQKEINKA